MNVFVKSIEIVNASSSTMSILSGKTLTTEEITGVGNILNNGTMVKTGDGTATIPFDNASKGVVVVSSGTLKVGSVRMVNENPYEFIAEDRLNQLVDVQEGAVFDLNGIDGLTASVRLAEGAKFINFRNDISDYKIQTVQIILSGNATATAIKNFSLRAPSHKKTRLDLGSHTLTLDGSSVFWLDNTTITGDGMIAVNAGTLSVTQRDSVGEDCTLIIGAGGNLALADDMTLTIKNFTNNGNAYGGGTGWLTVTGTLATGNILKRVALNDGATVKASATAPQMVKFAFSAVGTVTIDASEITREQLKGSESGIAVLVVPTEYKSGTWRVSNSPVADVYTKWKDNEDNTSTLYLCRPSGTMIIVR